MTRNGSGSEERALNTAVSVDSQIPLDIIPSRHDTVEDRTDIKPPDMAQSGHLTKLARCVLLHGPMVIVHVDDDHVPCWDYSPGY